MIWVLVQMRTLYRMTVQTVDPRLDFTVGRRGIPFLDWGIMRGKAWIRDQGNAGPYVYKKNMFKKSEAGYLFHHYRLGNRYKCK